MRIIRTSFLIAAPPSKVWAVLIAFREYSQWNPLNVSAEGEARTGARVLMTFVDAGAGKGKLITQTVTVTRCEPECLLEWVGRIPLLFTGRHRFKLKREGDGTRLLHGEDLSGLLPSLFSSQRLSRQAAAYDQMNEALASRVEQLSS
jgi:hypothetical protein